MAESKGFEPLVAFTTQPFQDCTLSRSDSSPNVLFNYTKKWIKYPLFIVFHSQFYIVVRYP